MYIMEFSQNDRVFQIGLVESIGDGRAIVTQIPGYRMKEEDGLCYEFFDSSRLPDYMELNYRGTRLPLSRHMFAEEGRVDIDWLEIGNLSLPGQGLIDGASRVDAYMVDNQDLENYIAKRENNWQGMKEILEAKGFEADRAYAGSEDGEAVVYRRKGEEDWHFLCHMDPFFVEEEDLESYLEGGFGEK